MKKLDNSKINIKSYDILRRPLVTEKVTALLANNQYAFEVNIKASKPQIKNAVEQIFNVEVLSVNTLRVQGKSKVFKGRLGQRSDLKKAIIRVKQGQTIDTSVKI